MVKRRNPEMSAGFTLIEVLITVVIIAIGLLGLATLQVTSLNSQLEAYHRAQALMLLEDMASRIRANAAVAQAGGYTVAVIDDYGLASEEDCSLETTTAAKDLCEWNLALAGAGVTLDAANLGSALGARGCIENIAGTAFGETIIRLTVAWQGTVATAAPNSLCGQGEYGDDALRRAVTLDTVLGDLS